MDPMVRCVMTQSMRRSKLRRPLRMAIGTYAVAPRLVWSRANFLGFRSLSLTPPQAIEFRCFRNYVIAIHRHSSRDATAFDSHGLWWRSPPQPVVQRDPPTESREATVSGRFKRGRSANAILSAPWPAPASIRLTFVILFLSNRSAMNSATGDGVMN